MLAVRGVAQLGSAHAWGAWGRKFESCRPDQLTHSHHETLAKLGERDEVQGVRNTGGETYQRDRRALRVAHNAAIWLRHNLKVMPSPKLRFARADSFAKVS